MMGDSNSDVILYSEVTVKAVTSNCFLFVELN